MRVSVKVALVASCIFMICGGTAAAARAKVDYNGMKNAYLLTLYSPCRDLDYSVEIALTSSGHQLSAGFDKVLVPGHESCRIKTIQPIDVKAMRVAEKAARLKNKRT